MNKQSRFNKSKSILPIMDWLPKYRRELLGGDINAGIIVTIVLIPQAMAYAMLAGLPPQVGLYSCLLPIMLYALFGSSSTLAVGPVGLVSLIVGSTIIEMGLLGQEQALTVAVTLAGMSGVLLLLMRMLQLGSVINFISHPVLSGFTSAAAVLIILSQIKHLLGLEIPRTVHLPEAFTNITAHLNEINPITAMLGISSIAIMLVLRSNWLRKHSELKLSAQVVDRVSRTGPLIIVTSGIIIVWWLALDKSANVNIVGAIPAGLPSLSLPSINMSLARELLPTAFIIAIVGYLESVSVAKALATRKRQKIDADQELLAHGICNLGASISGGYPTAGGFGRSMVNYDSGANTPLASIITVILMSVALLFLTPLLYYLPHSVLAAIIIVAVSALIDYRALKHAWLYDKADALALLVTFVMVLTLGVEIGILTGASLSIGIYLHRSSKPHVAVIGRVGDSEHFRNVDRFEVKTCPHVITMRVDENLYFSNTNFIEDTIINLIAENQQAKHLVIVCSSVNIIDASALEALDTIIDSLRQAGVTVHLAEVKGPVMDRLKKSPLLQNLQPGQVFLSTHEAMNALGCS